MYSHSLLKRFVKDYSLPIQIVREPYFSYYLDLYDSYLNTKQKYLLLCDTVESLGGEENFFEQYHKIKDEVLSAIKQQPIFEEFNSSKLEAFNVPRHQYCRHDVFNLANVGRIFVSIDLKKANFNAMKYYSKSLVLDYDTYDDFMRNFTDLSYMIESKYIRQVIFGNLNPKKQIKIQQYLTYNILEHLVEGNYLDKAGVRMLSTDEIVFELNNRKFDDASIACLIKDKFGLDVDIEIYKLQQIKPYPFFVKEFLNKHGQELMCIPVVYHAQAYKKYFDLELIDYDLCFWYENQIAQFLKPLEEMESDADESGTDISETEY